jgi:PEGA domain
MRCVALSLVLIIILYSPAHANADKDAAKDPPPSGLVMFWPSQDNAILKLTFGHFQNLATYGSQMTLVSTVLVQNVSPNLLPKASFSVSLLDKERVRVGSGTLVIDELNAGESAKVQFQCESSGAPSVISIAARNNNGAPVSMKTIPMTVISVPAGASLKVDNKDLGLTPAKINVGIGTHQLELTKEGFAVATTPLEVAPDEAPGGSITITLGGLSDDTVELRDGSILTGSVISMTMEQIVIEVNGQKQTLDRNRVKKMFLVERIITHPGAAPTSPKKQTSGAAQSPNN